MKGKIEKYKGFWGDVAYRITYDRGIFASEEVNVRTLDIAIEDMDEFMDDIFSSWMKLDNKIEIVERRAREAVKARKGWIESEKEEAHRQGYIKGWCKGYFKGKKEGYLEGRKELVDKMKVITKQEEAEQDRDEQEMDLEKEIDKVLKSIPKTKGWKRVNTTETWDSDTDDPIEYDVHVCEKDCNKTKTYNNFPTDEALDFDVNIRERV